MKNHITRFTGHCRPHLMEGKAVLTGDSEL